MNRGTATGAAGAGGTTAPAEAGAAVSRLTSDKVWDELAKASFAVVSYATPAGMPRSSGVLYATARRRLYVVTGAGSWKARHIAACGTVAVTVPVRRGGLMSLLLPIPPATISFHGSAIVHPASSLEQLALPKRFLSQLPPGRRNESRIIEIVPEGYFLTYGVGVSLGQMRDPTVAGARVTVA